MHLRLLRESFLKLLSVGIIGGMFARHPAESGDNMYLNYSKLEALRSLLNHDAAFLREQKEDLDRQLARLAVNTQTKQVVTGLKKASGKLEEQLHTLKLMAAVLERVEEEYADAEDRITDRIENGGGVRKKRIVAYQRFSGLEIFRRLLR